MHGPEAGAVGPDSPGHGIREEGRIEEQADELSSHFCGLIQSNFPEGRLTATHVWWPQLMVRR